jgi:DNA-binding NarL/FixJ family response regulator
LVYESASLTLIVDDDGRGNDRLHANERVSTSHRRIVEHVYRVGGTARVESTAGSGTTVQARFPYLVPPSGVDRLDIAVVAADAITNAGLSRIIAWSDPAISVVGELIARDSILPTLVQLRPDVVVVGPDRGTVLEQVSVIKQVKQGCRDTALLAICDLDVATSVSQALLAGAGGCVGSGADGPELVHAIIAAARGRSIVPELGSWLAQAIEPENKAGLTPREREIKALLEEALSDRIIAHRLNLSIKTVEKHVGAVLRKCQVRSRTELLLSEHSGVHRRSRHGVSRGDTAS